MQRAGDAETMLTDLMSSLWLERIAPAEAQVRDGGWPMGWPCSLSLPSLVRAV